MCPTFGTLKIISFQFVTMENVLFLGVPKVGHIFLVLGHLKIINFPFVTNGKFIIFRCPSI